MVKEDLTNSNYKFQLSFGNEMGFATSRTVNGCNAANGCMKYLTAGSWHHIVGVNTSDSMTVYFDGVKYGAFKNAWNNNSLVTNNLPLVFGRLTYDDKNVSDKRMYFDGKLDDYGIWSRALSSSEITDLYNGCKLSISTDPTNQSSNINGKAQFIAIASDTTSSYQWQSKQANLSWGDIPPSSFYTAVTSKKLTVNNIQINNHKQLFRVIATKNTCKDTSTVAMLTVNDTCITNVYDTIAVQDTLIINAKLTGTIPLKTNLIKVYPNPAKDHLVIDFGNYSSMAGYSITIFDVAGKSVYNSTINKSIETIDLNTWTGKGVYFVKIYDKQSQQIENRKIVIQ